MNSSRALPFVLGALLLVSTTTANAGELGEPKLGSVHAMVVDMESGEPLYTKHSNRVVPIASITKLMTALVVLESGAPLDEWLRVRDWHREPAANAYSRIRLGSELPRRELLRISLMSSENRAAYNLAWHHPGGFDAFIEAMNAKARELGMMDTRFVDPSGLSTDNVSTAADLVQLMAAASEHDPITQASSTAGKIVHFRRPGYTLGYRNTNLLAHRDYWHVGVSKTGYLDDAGRCLVMTTRIDGRQIGMVLLDSLGKRTPIGDVGRIQSWLETGRSGPVAGAARDYEQARTASYQDKSEQQQTVSAP